MDWIQTYSGRKLTPREIEPGQVGPIEEIAHVLAAKVRFNGHTRAPYSVAEHCVRGAAALPQAFAGAFLLHELGEVYLPDVPSPIKGHLRVLVSDPDTGEPRPITWAELERQHESAILASLGLSSILPLIHSPEIRAMDLRLLVTEARDLLGPPPEPWAIVAEPLQAKIDPWPYNVASAAFLSAFAGAFK